MVLSVEYFRKGARLVGMIDEKLDATDGTSKPRLRVLLSAFAIEPNQGSEPGIGWNVASRLAQYHDVTVFCGDIGSDRRKLLVLEEYFRLHGTVSGLTIEYIPPSVRTRILSWCCGLPGLGLLYYSAYNSWQRDAFARALLLHESARFDIAHHLTFGSFREPGYLWRLPIPFVWGPISGASSPPVRMLFVGGARSAVRSLANFFQKRFARRSILAARKAAMTWVSTDDDSRLIRRWGGKCEPQFDVGTSFVSERARTRRPGEPLRFVWSGSHIPRKALPIALHAFSRLPKDGTFHMQVLGKGKDTARCQALAKSLKIDHLLTWHGQCDHKAALEIMSRAHALLHTSITEATSTVVLEALGLGLPVVCHDACGMHLAITEECGIKVPLRDRDTSIDGFTCAMGRLGDVARYGELSAGAIRRAAELTWDKKVLRMSQLYRAACPVTAGS